MKNVNTNAQNQIIDVEVEERKGFIKKGIRKVGSGAKWLWNKRKWFEVGAVAAFAIYVKGRFAGERFERERSEERIAEELQGLRELTGAATGMTEEQINNAQTIRDVCSHCELDVSKLMSIYENWSEDDWEEFVQNKYGC